MSWGGGKANSKEGLFKENRSRIRVTSKQTFLENFSSVLGVSEFPTRNH